MKNVPAHASRLVRFLTKLKFAPRTAWKAVCVTGIMFSVEVSALLKQHAVAPLRAATTNQASASGPMRIAVVAVNATPPWDW